MNLTISAETWVCLGIIAIVFIFCVVLILRYQNNDKLVANRRIVEYLPSLVSTLGVLGTFWGITRGLMTFDTLDLDNSIPKLLNGLKTAFFTSLAGMLGSMILSAFINRKQDEKDGGISSINQAAGDITQSIKAMSDFNIEAMRSIQNQMAEQEADRKAFYRTIGDTVDKMCESQKTVASAIDSLVLLHRSQEISLTEIKEINTSALAAFGNLEQTVSLQNNSINLMLNYTQEVSEHTHHLGEILDVISDVSGTGNEINEKLSKLKDIIHGEILEIGDYLSSTNELLEIKFNEFSELLKKSNTEALVEVMKKVTEEFQQQMSTLINKLVQENFEQLNKSVERLNVWQQENKEMITSLTQQYKEMSENFETTSDTLSHVKDNTKALVSDGGKLHQLITTLSQVIVEDERFIKVTSELHEAAKLSKSNMESFDESTRSLNEWIRKQRNLTDEVRVLVSKLEELNKIRDYGEHFWKSTKEKMEEGVNIISRGSQTLNTQLTSLDRQFYGRLSATLAELDNCITKMVEQIANRR